MEDTSIKSTFDLLHERLKSFSQDPIKNNKERSVEYNKKWNEAVQHFQKRINKDRKKENQKEVSFIAVRQKLIAVTEIDHLRWFYGKCLEYTQKRKNGFLIKGNTFSKCFWGSLK